MGARIIDLTEARARRRPAATDSAVAEAPAGSTERFHFWTGASGQSYVHTVYSLIECPALPACNYVLVRRDAQGRRHLLAVARACNEAPSLNLAEIRRRGAQQGANEVHVHLLAASAMQSRLIEFDLKSGQLGAAVVEPLTRVCH